MELLPETGKVLLLVKQPGSQLSADCWQMTEQPLAPLEDGSFRIRNVIMSVDPYMIPRMLQNMAGMRPYPLGEPMAGRAIGEVVESRNPAYEVGSYVQTWLGWREYAVSDGTEVKVIDPDEAPFEAQLSVLGTPGRTAWVGLLDLAQVKAGDTVFISSGASAIGSAAIQIAKATGCKVIAAAGSDAKVTRMRELGADIVFNYKTQQDLTETVHLAAPDGLDAYIDLVGGSHLQAAIAAMKKFGRIVVIGAMPPVQPGPNNLAQLSVKNLLMQGMNNANYVDREPAFRDSMLRWIGEGKVVATTSVSDGLETALERLIGIYDGSNMGKPLIRLGPDRMQEQST